MSNVSPSPAPRPAVGSNQVPASAFRLAVPGLRIGQLAAADDAAPKAAPIEVLARTGQPIEHWYWGRIVHDMAGLRLHKQSLPLDYCHECDEVIGFLDQFDTTSGDLKCGGKLTPFEPDDRASEILYKSAQGVPYEASIFFDPNDALIEWLAEKMVATVNGQQVEGPAVIVRQWSLRGVAVCPYGADRNTSAQFSAQPNQFTITIHEGTAMSVETKTPETKPETVTPPAAAELSAETKPEAASADAGKAAAAPPAKTGQDYLAAFGQQGAVWFVEGLAFEAATKLHVEALAAERDALKAKLAAVEGQFGEKPLSGGAAPTPEETKATELGQKYGQNLGRFAAGIQLPGNK